MEDNKIQGKTKSKTIRLDIELISEIEKMAEENEREFSAQVRYMLKEYIKIKARI